MTGNPLAGRTARPFSGAALKKATALLVLCALAALFIFSASAEEDTYEKRLTRIRVSITISSDYAQETEDILNELMRSWGCLALFQSKALSYGPTLLMTVFPYEKAEGFVDALSKRLNLTNVEKEYGYVYASDLEKGASGQGNQIPGNYSGLNYILASGNPNNVDVDIYITVKGSDPVSIASTTRRNTGRNGGTSIPENFYFYMLILLIVIFIPVIIKVYPKQRKELAQITEKLKEVPAKAEEMRIARAEFKELPERLTYKSGEFTMLKKPHTYEDAVLLTKYCFASDFARRVKRARLMPVFVAIALSLLLGLYLTIKYDSSILILILPFSILVVASLLIGYIVFKSDEKKVRNGDFFLYNGKAFGLNETNFLKSAHEVISTASDYVNRHNEYYRLKYYKACKKYERQCRRMEKKLTKLTKDSPEYLELERRLKSVKEKLGQ